MIGVIADDLTGAAEIGAVGLRHGLRAEIIVQNAGRAMPDAELVCLDTNSRSCTAAEAGRRAAAAARQLANSGADWIYKKVDSVLRGNVIAEIEAILKQLRLKRALLLPANPALGRVIRNGHYFIRGRPLQETEFASDPEHPRLSSSVIELLGRSESFPLSASRAEDPLPAKGIVIGDVAAVRDLARWAARRKPGMLCAGGSGFFDALLKIRSRRGNEAEFALAPRRPPPHVGSYARQLTELPELFVCGTTSRSAREFLSAARRNLTPVLSLPRELARSAEFKRSGVEAVAGRAITALRSHRRVILTIGLPPVRERVAGRRLAMHLVRVAAAVLRREEIGQVYAEGGATAIALVRRMGWRRLTLRREAAPGVATLQVAGPGSLQLTIKPGSYEWPPEIRRNADRRSAVSQAAGLRAANRSSARRRTGSPRSRKAR